MRIVFACLATTLAHGSAERADCEDVGEGAAGSVFPDDPDTVTAWTFDGYPATEVLGIRYGKNSFGVFVADTVPAEERDRIYADLTKRRLTLHTPEG